jgi:hypothetical protein
MKRIVLSGLTVLLLSSTLTPAALAQRERPQMTRFPEMSAKMGMGVNPFNLVFLAFQGFFAVDGLPMGEYLIQDYTSGKVAAKDLVQSAVKMNRLPSSALEDSSFINSVDQQLRRLVQTSQ